MTRRLARPRPGIVIALTMIATAALIFSVSGVFDLRVDGLKYAAQIESFAAGRRSGADHLDYRLLYPVLGGSILHTTHPFAFILVVNLAFYVVLAVASYRLLRAMSFTDGEALVGTLWIASAYPVLKYGLALGTDISGWAMSAATLAVGLTALKRDSIRLLLAASALGAVGSFAKETGAAGLVAVCLLVLWRYRARGVGVVLTRLAAVALPAAAACVLVLLAHERQTSIVSDWADWLQRNRAEAGGTRRQSWHALAAVEASSFGVLWLCAACAPAVWRKRLAHLDVVVAAFLATLPVLIWPFFVSRVLFIQFLWMVPLALGAYAHVHREDAPAPPGRRVVTGLIVVAPIAVNVALFLVSRGGSLFDVLGWR